VITTQPRWDESKGRWALRSALSAQHSAGSGERIAFNTISIPLFPETQRKKDGHAMSEPRKLSEVEAKIAHLMGIDPEVMRSELEFALNQHGGRIAAITPNGEQGVTFHASRAVFNAGELLEQINELVTGLRRERDTRGLTFEATVSELHQSVHKVWTNVVHD
jgi:hypothetical protein